MRKSRILYLINDLKVGGAEKMLLTLAEGMVRRGNRVRIVLLRREGRLLDRAGEAGLETVDCGLRTPRDIVAGFMRFTGIARRFRPDIIHTFLFYSDITGRLARPFIPGARLVCSMRNTDNWRTTVHILADRFTSPLADMIISNTVAGASRLARIEKIPARKIVVVPNCIDEKAFETVLSKSEARRELSIKDDETVILAAGRLTRQKGFTCFIEAARLLLENTSSPPLRFLLAGDGPEKNSLEQLARKKGIHERFTFLGDIPDLRRVMAGADIFCLSSIYEGMPNVVLEAMAQKLPVVATDVGGVREIAPDDSFAITVRPRSSTELAGALRILVNSPSLRRAMGEKGCARVKSLFTVERMVEKTALFYNRLLESSEARA